MDFISAWLKGIVLIILFATFMDLLLPSSSMQKYVKLVIGLIIIVTMLTPLLMILKSDYSFSTAEMLDWQRGESIVATAIDDVSQRMQHGQQDMAVVAVENMIKDGIGIVLEANPNYSLVDVEMKIQEEPNQQFKLSNVSVYVKASKIHESHTTTQPIEHEVTDDSHELNIDVQEVSVIQIDSIEISKPSNQTSKQMKVNDSEINEIKQLLSKKLECNPNIIDIYLVKEE
ncbi:stage III sporulation protein AF [Desulfuribacillus stibiiarsenatis]|uniref:Stage III sporulation protein AF n=1 Tax=Desulfuribacillus stibiiarsenatis TaxID=1390249 RepID=A0A1E5L6M9_9FIRM|nr:stage III sporulation protein AF [Desulfuribacillus stibiiarsenatis]OEH85654.1 stage III sporulation protein AF [Desulfuribacillus stibiiarsenatis]